MLGITFRGERSTTGMYVVGSTFSTMMLSAASSRNPTSEVDERCRALKKGWLVVPRSVLKFIFDTLLSNGASTESGKRPCGSGST